MLINIYPKFLNRFEAIRKSLQIITIAIGSGTVGFLLNRGKVSPLTLPLIVAIILFLLAAFSWFGVGYLKKKVISIQTQNAFSHLNDRVNHRSRKEFIESLFNESDGIFLDEEHRHQDLSRSELARLIGQIESEVVERALKEEANINVDDRGLISREFRALLAQALENRREERGDSRFVNELFIAAKRIQKTHPLTVTLKEFSEVDWNEHQPDILLIILKRYTDTWEIGEKRRVEKNQRINLIKDRKDQTRWFNCPVDDLIRTPVNEIPSFVYRIISHPHFFRLVFVKQLSTTFLWQNPEATHTRWSHSIGVLKRVVLFLECLTDKGVEMAPVEKEAICLYALIHDLYHGPFGHSLELMRDLFKPPLRDQRLDVNHLFKELNNENSPLREMINEADLRSSSETVISYLKLFILKDEFLSQVVADEEADASVYADSFYLADILESPLDADRIDYLIRDSLHLGENLRDDEDLASTVEKIEDAVENINIIYDEVNGIEVTRLCFSSEDHGLISDILERRKQLYEEHYEGSEKLAIDEMIVHALYEVLRFYRVSLPPDDPRGTSREIVDTINQLTDYQLLDFLSSFSRPLITHELARSILNNSFYIVIEEFRFTPSRSRWEDPYDVSPEISADLAEDERLKEMLDTVARVCSERFEKKLVVERKFWSKLRNSTTFGMKMRKYGLDPDELPEKSRVFISFPPVLNVKEEVQNPDELETIQWCPNEELEHHEAEAEIDDFNVILCGPRWLNEEELKNQVITEFRSFILGNEQSLLDL